MPFIIYCSNRFSPTKYLYRYCDTKALLKCETGRPEYLTTIWPLCSIASPVLLLCTSALINIITQTDRFALSSLRKQGSRNVTGVVDSRFRGNDKSRYVIVIEQLEILFGSKSVSLSSIRLGSLVMIALLRAVVWVSFLLKFHFQICAVNRFGAIILIFIVIADSIVK